MRVLGIDPGTGSFDMFGMEGDKVILDTSLSVPKVAADPNILLETAASVFPLDIIVGPSGYGIPVTHIKDMGDNELDLMVPAVRKPGPPAVPPKPSTILPASTPMIAVKAKPTSARISEVSLYLIPRRSAWSRIARAVQHTLSAVPISSLLALRWSGTVGR